MSRMFEQIMHRASLSVIPFFILLLTVLKLNSCSCIQSTGFPLQGRSCVLTVLRNVL